MHHYILDKTFSLNEGLIKTEPIEKLVKHAKEYCNFASSADEYNRGNYQGVIRIVDGSNGTKAIKTIFHKSEYNEKLIDTMFNTYGYFKSKKYFQFFIEKNIFLFFHTIYI